MSSFTDHVSSVRSLLVGDDDCAARHVGDGAAFARFVDAHKLHFLVATRPESSPLRARLSAADRETIDAYCARQRARQESLHADLVRVADAFAAAGIDFVLLKGLYFAERYYGGLWNRFSWDLDLLVRREDARSADRVLRANGFFRRSAVLLGATVAARFVHAFDYGTRRPGPALDLHWGFSTHPSFRIDYDAVWAERSTYALLGREYSVLSPEHEVVSNALSSFRDIQRGAIRLRAFVDLYRVLEAADATIDWARMLERVERERVGAITANVVALLLELFDCRERFSGAAGFVASASRLVVPVDGGVAALFEPAPGALANRAWTAEQYACARRTVAAWWLVSLPFRLAVYRPGRYAKLKWRLFTWREERRRAADDPATAVRAPGSPG